MKRLLPAFRMTRPLLLAALLGFALPGTLAPVSTAELRLLGSGERLSFELVQHKAQRNGCPSTLAAQTMARLLERLAEDDLQPRLQEMREQLVQRRALDGNRQRWLAATPLAPNRLHCLKTALKLHVTYERFLEAGRKALAR